MLLSYQYRLYPFQNQLGVLEDHRRELTFLWNFALGQRKDAWRTEQRSVSYFEQQRDLTRWRNYDREGLGRLSFDVAQDSLQRLDLAFRAFFRRVKDGEKPGYPRFRRTVNSFTCPHRLPASPVSPGPNGTWRVKFPRVGEIPLRLHRPLPTEASVKTVTVKYEAGAWYATLAVEMPDPSPPPSAPPTNPVGVDVGLTHLATLSTGETVEPPKFFRKAERRLALEQRRLSRRRRGSHRYQQQRTRVAKCQAKVRRQRKSFAHQLSHEWADRFDLISFEETDDAAFREGNPLAKAMADAGWGMLRELTHYKMTIRSKRCVDVPARNTTQTCFHCGRLADPPLMLKDRMFSCPCGWVADRDSNAAQNILARGLTLLSELRRSTAEVTRTESRPPPRRKGRRSYQRRRAGSVNCEGVGNRPLTPGPEGPGADPAEPLVLTGPAA
ncbi:MAG: transposase [Thermoplasmata archaeon]